MHDDRFDAPSELLGLLDKHSFLEAFSLTIASVISLIFMILFVADYTLGKDATFSFAIMYLLHKRKRVVSSQTSKYLEVQEKNMVLRSLAINLEVGQEIIVGAHNDHAKITKIEYHETSGEVTINTTKGPRKVLTFKLSPTYAEDWISPADKYR